MKNYGIHNQQWKNKGHELDEIGDVIFYGFNASKD